MLLCSLNFLRGGPPPREKVDFGRRRFARALPPPFLDFHCNYNATPIKTAGRPGPSFLFFLETPKHTRRARQPSRSFSSGAAPPPEKKWTSPGTRFRFVRTPSSGFFKFLYVNYKAAPIKTLFCLETLKHTRRAHQPSRSFSSGAAPPPGKKWTSPGNVLHALPPPKPAATVVIFN